VVALRQRKSEGDCQIHQNIKRLLPSLVAYYITLVPTGFTFQQDGTSAHTAWISTSCPEFIGKDEWTLNSPDLNLLGYHEWGAMLDLNQQYQPRRKKFQS